MPAKPIDEFVYALNKSFSQNRHNVLQIRNKGDDVFICSINGREKLQSSKARFFNDIFGACMSFDEVYDESLLQDCFMTASSVSRFSDIPLHPDIASILLRFDTENGIRKLMVMASTM